MTSTCRLMIDGRRFALTDSVGNSVFMAGDFNTDFTELSGIFNDGSKFVASKRPNFTNSALVVYLKDFDNV